MWVHRRSLKPVRLVVRAFHACLVRISSDPSDGSVSGMRVDGSPAFNAVVRLCVTSLYPTLKKIMHLPSATVTKKHVETSKKWSFVKPLVRSYIIDLIKVLLDINYCPKWFLSV